MALNMFGQYASPEDEYAALYGALSNPGVGNPGYTMPSVDLGLINQINGQGTTLVNPGAGTEYAVMPSDPYTYTGPAAAPPAQGTGLYPGMPQSPNYTAPGGGTNTPPPPPALPPAPQYATSMGMQGAENVGGVGMYTGSNAPLDTTRFDPQRNMDFVRNIDQITYYKYVLPFQQRGGDITNQAAVRQAIEQGLRNAGGGTYAVGSQTFNVPLSAPGTQTGNPVVQQSGPTPPLPPPPPSPPPQTMQPPPPQPQPYFPPQQQQNPYTNPYGTQYQPPRLQIDQPNPFSMGMRGGMGQPAMVGYGGMNPSGVAQMDQLIAMAMARGAMSSGQQTMYPQPGLNLQGYPSSQINKEDAYRQQQQQGYLAQRPADPAMNQARMFEMYGYGGGGGGEWHDRDWSMMLPNIDFRAATFPGQQSTAPPQSSGNIGQPFTPPRSNTTANIGNPWANVTNRLPSLSNSYSYGWGR